MAEQAHSPSTLPAVSITTDEPTTSLDVLSTVSTLQPEAHATTDDVHEAIQHLDALAEIEDGLAEAAQQVAAEGGKESAEARLQHAEQIEETMEQQMGAELGPLNLPMHDSVMTHDDDNTNGDHTQDLDEDRAYASSEDAEGEIDLDLGGMDEEYEPEAYGQGELAYDPEVMPKYDVDAYNDASGVAKEDVPMSTVDNTTQASTSASEIVQSEQKQPTFTTPVVEVKAEVADAKPVAIRRRPEEQRRSPSYTAEPPQTASSDTPIPIPPPFLPARPSTVVPPNAVTRPATTTFDLSEVKFPEGLSVESPSVKRHGIWVQAWKGAEGYPQTQAQALLELFKVSRDEGEVEDARAWFNELSKENPTVTGPLLSLINLELAHGNFPQVVALYEKALRGLGGPVGATPGVEIWKSYLHYIRRQNPIPPPGSANAANADAIRETVKRAYEFALNETGNDLHSSDIWKEYIAFLQEKEATNAWEIQQQQDVIRKVYHRAVVIPLQDVEQLWREYDQFENKINKMTAKKFLQERSPLYMTARSVLQDLRRHLEPLVPNEIPPRPLRNEQDRAMVVNWRKYIKWEESNPLDIEDTPTLQSRIGYAYRKCLTQMRFYPELWYAAANYYQTQDKMDDMLAYIKTGLEANPSSFLLTFAFAEQHEVKRDVAACKGAFDRLIALQGKQIDKLKDVIEAEAEAARGPPMDETEQKRMKEEEDIEIDGEPTDLRKRFLERAARGKAVIDRRQPELNELLTSVGVIWNMYIRCMRRSEGLKAARSTFTSARKSPYISWHVYESSALMEYHCNKDQTVAIKIFELGLKAFPEDIAFAVKFLQFLLQLNDESNARALFERLVSKFSGDSARPIWDTWSRYEYMFGDLAATQKMEKRISDAYPADAPLKRFASRFAYNGIDEIASRDLGFGSRAVMPPPPALPRLESQTVNSKRAHPESPRQSPRLPEQRYRNGRDDRAAQMSSNRNEEPRIKRVKPSSPPRREPVRIGRRELSPPMRDQRPPMIPGPPVPEMDRSGLPKAVVWFMGNLPRPNQFDGPLFHADDIMNVLSTVTIPTIPMPSGPPGPRVNSGLNRDRAVKL
ncbi:hypothetical protein QFC22_004899 [Naganishia vaughanmartiniae]|uniref:Uncharacterized protein n=1 Tax=Naganishia vaughanmartiniae TaxID=1424756 RepID=A0ACC2WZI8_9TREE|nr:hypothetical protein QFC22_004899 [Naganishia vaughanmartiniae]